jgi:simple sugar transport system permease protein
MEKWFVDVMSRALACGTPLLLGTLGEIYAERSGVLNLGVEGMMILGAFVAFATAYTTSNPWLAILLAGLVGGLASLIHAFLSITLCANQIISGLALTMFGLGLAGILGRGWEGRPLQAVLPTFTLPGFQEIPILGKISFQSKTA